MTSDITRELLGKIVDEVFDGGLEDTSVVEDIYRVIKREEAALSTPNPGDADGWSSTDNAAPGTEKYALQRALEFIEGLTADPLLTGDNVEMTLDDVRAHARIELDSIIRQRFAFRSGVGET